MFGVTVLWMNRFEVIPTSGAGIFVADRFTREVQLCAISSTGPTRCRQVYPPALDGPASPPSATKTHGGSAGGESVDDAARRLFGSGTQTAR